MKKLILIFAFGMLIISCSKQEHIDVIDTTGKVVLTQDEANVLSFISPREMEQREVLVLAENFINAQNEASKTRAVSSTLSISKKSFVNTEGEFASKEIASRSGELDEDISGLTTPIYEVAVNSPAGEGLIMVSGDAMYPTVLAYIPHTGNETAMELSGANDMLKLSKKAYIGELLLKKAQADTVKVDLLNKISSALNMSEDEITFDKIKDRIIVEGASGSRATAIPGKPAGVQINSTETIWPKVITNWGQFSPYNDQFYINQALVGMVDKGDGWGGQYLNYPVGCVNIAIGQVLSFTKNYLANMSSVGIYAANVPWDGINGPNLETYSSSAQFGVKNMLKWLYEKNGTTPVTDWKGDVIATSTTEDRMIACMRQFFTFDNKTTFNADQMWAALRKNRVAICAIGDDHVIIISGMLVTSIQQTRQLVQDNDVYWHVNFGWADECTGYYKVNRPAADCLLEAGQYVQWDYQLSYWNNIRSKGLIYNEISSW